MNSAELRASFLHFFEKQKHSIVTSSPLIPADDPTLLFTNAGMVQFKDVFLGKVDKGYNRATTSQKCLRAGGKHNDLENVGYTARHHTFFEMLGNFSFGDYFKEEAIKFAWEFLTEVLKLPKEKLWVTVFHDDSEAEAIWLEQIGMPKDRLTHCGEKDNFWSMGDTGPCGPCTEIFYDHGSDVAGGPPGSADEDGDRFVEIWNLVFMQYNRDENGTLNPLPKPSVDTGMGLERIAAVMQGVHNNYDTDLFTSIIQAAAKLAKVSDLTNSSLRVIADHIRACAFLLLDGVRPSNEGRGYVLRRIIRRAVRHGHQLGIDKPFFHLLLPSLVGVLGEAYPELAKQESMLAELLLQEEKQFRQTLSHGLRILDAELERLDGDTISGELVFKLYDTYGFPEDLTADIARGRGLNIDTAGFEAAMSKQKKQSRAHNQFKLHKDAVDFDSATDFVGYDQDSCESELLALFVDGVRVEKLSTGQQAVLVLDKTAFYAESGGQVGDIGFISVDSNQFKVLNTTKQDDLFLHHGELLTGELSEGQQVVAQIDLNTRNATRLNHSATHLMHAALQEVLGPHVVQKGSMVDSERLRFDFAHFKPVTLQEIEQVESIVNEMIRDNSIISTELMEIDAARAKGAMALFGEKYADEVRVLTMGRSGYSIELCGGTHAKRCGDIGLFKITLETSIAAGVRRIEAVSGQVAIEHMQKQNQLLQNMAESLHTGVDGLEEKFDALQNKVKESEKEIALLKKQLSQADNQQLLNKVTTIGGVKILISAVENIDAKLLRELVCDLKDQLSPAVVCLVSVASKSKLHLVSGVSKECTDRVQAGKLVNFAAKPLGGKGGGKPELAQAGGTDATKLDTVLEQVTDWVVSQLTIGPASQ